MRVASAVNTIGDMYRGHEFREALSDPSLDVNTPEAQQKLLAIDPGRAAQIGINAPSIYDLQQKRGGAMALYGQRSIANAKNAYINALGTADTGEPMAEGSTNYAGAEKAMNDSIQLAREGAKRVYGDTFANKALPPIGDLPTLERYSKSYDAITQGMKVMHQVITTDPETGQKSVKTVGLLPGQESQYAQDNPGSVLLKMGEGVPLATTNTGGGFGPTLDTTGKMSPGPLAEQSAKERDFFTKLPSITRFQAAEPAYATGKQSIRLGTKEGDTQAAVKLALLDNPGAVATEGGVQTVANPGLLSAQNQQYLNWLNNQGGVWTPEQRKEIDKALDTTYGDYREQLTGQLADQNKREELIGLPKNSTTGLVQPLSEAKLKALRDAPFHDTAKGTAPNMVPQFTDAKTVDSERAKLPVGALYIAPDGKLHKNTGK